MIHARQGLPFGIESGNYLLRITAKLDDLQGNDAPNGPTLFRFVHGSEAAFVQRFKDAVWADRPPHQRIGAGPVNANGGPVNLLQESRFYARRRLVVEGQKALHLLAHLEVIGTPRFQLLVALGGGELQKLREKVFDALVLLGGHEEAPLPSMDFRIQALARSSAASFIAPRRPPANENHIQRG
jgi:hypothetical protein